MADPRLIFPGDSRMAAMMRDHDWSASPLGSPQAWPASLRAVIGLMLESRVAMFVAWGGELGFLYNDAYAEILGAKHPAALGRRFRVIWAEIWPDIEDLVDAAMSGRSIYREDLPLVMNRQGTDEQTWFTFSYSPVRDADGAVAGMYCACWETTTKFLAERALRQSEARLRALTRASSNVIYRMNADWSRMLELEGQGLLADATAGDANWMDSYVPPQDRALVRAAVQRAIDSGGMFELEHRVIQADGSLGWTLSRAIPVRDAEGRVAEWFGAASDVTQRHEAQEALHEANRTLERRVAEALAERKLLADLVEATDAIVQVLDLDGRWMAFNQAALVAFRSVYGIRPVLGASLFDALAPLPQDQAMAMALWRRAFAGESFVEVAEFGDPARARRTFEIRFNALLGSDGAPIGAYQFVHDVTERLHEQARLRHAEESLRHAQKLESLGQLTGGVAHDFNNLLQVIANGISLVQARGDAASSRHTLDGMRRAVKRGTDLTRHLLAFSRRQPVNPTPMQLEPALSGMREMLSRSLRGDIGIEMRFGPELWPVSLDAGELELAVLNLCVNARDAMAAGGTIRIDADNAPGAVVSERAGDFVRLRIRDDGSGMSDAVRARAFDPFFTTKETGKGSGLGLAQVYGFATQAGGDVQLDSAPGAGTTVTLWLPRTHANAGPPLPRAPASPPAAAPLRGRVLFVEDDPEVATLSAEMLRALGLEVVHVIDAARALQALADDAGIDVLFSDVMIPGGVSGVELAHRARQQRPALPIVLATGYAASASDGRAQAFALLLKPYGIDELAAALATALAGDT